MALAQSLQMFVCRAFSHSRTAGGVGLCCCSRCSSSRRAGWYDKYFAFNMAFGMQEYEAAILPVKQQLFSQLFAGLTQEDSSTSAHQATGSASNKPLSLLEVGIGTGSPCLLPVCEVLVIYQHPQEFDVRKILLLCMRLQRASCLERQPNSSQQLPIECWCACASFCQ